MAKRDMPKKKEKRTRKITLIADNQELETIEIKDGNFEIPNYEPPVMDPKTLVPVYVITDASVNFRKDPSIVEGNIIYVVKAGEKFLLLDRPKDWVHVQTLTQPPRNGFIKAKFVHEV